MGAHPTAPLPENPNKLDKTTERSSTQHGNRILPFLFLLSVVTYLDRVNISIATPAIRAEFGIDAVHMGVIFSAFVVGYMLFQIPGGWLGDSLGHKRALIFSLVCWSVFTGMTPLAGHNVFSSTVGLLSGFWLLRFLVGVGEAAAYPCANGIIGDTFSLDRRAFAAGVMFAGIGVGSAITPPFVAWCMLHFGWRSAFYVAAMIGFVLAVALQFGIPSSFRPGRLQQLAPTPWKQILSNRQVWLLVTSIFFFGYVTYVYYFWFFPYLVGVRKISLMRSSVFTALPFLMMALSAPLGGAISDRMVRAAGKQRARRRVAMTGLIAAAVLIIVGARTNNAYAAIACLSLGAGSVYLAISSYFATALDIFPQHGATISGTMNTGAGLGGVIAPIITPYVADKLGWGAALSVAGFFALFAACLWLFIGTDKSEYSQAGNNP